MMKNNKLDSISEVVMSKIKNGKVTIKPRAYFTLLGILSAIIVVLSGIITSYLSSIMFYWIRIQTANNMAFGARANLSELITTFPWWALIFAGVIFILAVILVQRHGKMYKHQPITIAIFLISLSLIFGLVLSLLGFGDIHNNRPGGRNQGQNMLRNR